MHCLQAQKALSAKNKGGGELLSSKHQFIQDLEVAEKIKKQEIKKGLLMRFRINVRNHHRFNSFAYIFFALQYPFRRSV